MIPALLTSESGAAKISEYLGDNGKGYALNVTDPASIEATLAAIKADFGRGCYPIA